MNQIRIDLYQYRPIPQNFGRIAVIDQDKDAVLLRGGLDAYELSPKDDEWLVTRDWAFWSARLQQVIYIPAWFVTDLASIPRAVRPVVPKGERERIAALIHDYLYLKSGNSVNSPSQKEADGVLRDFCKLSGVGSARRNAIYYAVRVFGGSHFRKRDSNFFAPFEHREFYLNAAEWGIPPLESEIVPLGLKLSH